MMACALPNFAALVPTAIPTPQTETSAAIPIVTPDRPLLQTVSIPFAPEAVDQLPSPPQFESQPSLPQLTAEVGMTYQIRSSTKLNQVPAPGQNLIYSLSAGGRLLLVDEAGNALPNLIQGQSGSSSYVFLPQADGAPLQVQIDIDTPPAASDYLLLTIKDLAQTDQVKLNVSGFINEEILERAEIQATAGRPFVAILQPSPGLDGVLELYGPAGYILTLDDKTTGEAETLIYEPDQTGKWVFTIFGFADSFGDFELTVSELPD